MKLIVVMLVDGDEITVLGIAPDDVAAALELVRENAGQYGDLSTDEIAHIDRMAHVALRDAIDAGWGDNFDIRFDSGVGSWDYQLVRTELKQ